MYKNILVAVDDTQLSQEAFEQALALAKAFGANLHLLHILHPLRAEYQNTTSLAFSGAYYPNTVYELTNERWNNLEVQGLNFLKSFCDQATKAGVTTEFTQQIGQIDRGIVEFSNNHNMDLLVVGSHGRKGLDEFLAGSVSNYVSHHATCSVLLVHQQQEKSQNQEDLAEAAR